MEDVPGRENGKYRGAQMEAREHVQGNIRKQWLE